MWFDIVLIAIIAIFVIIGIVKGLFDSLLSLISTAISLVIAILLAKPTANLLNKWFNVPKMFTSLVDKITTEETINLFGNSALSFTKVQITNFLSIVFAVLVVFILIRVAIFLLARLFSSVVSNSTIASGLNKVLGGLFGLIKGFVIVLVILTAISAVNSTGILGDKFTDTMNNSKVTNFVYKYVDDFTEKALQKADIQDTINNLIENNQETK